MIAFFLAEMGDKTQIATVALAARYSSTVAVVAGTTFGMMLANVPAVYFGERIANRVPLRVVHGIAALIFAALGVATCWERARDWVLNGVPAFARTTARKSSTSQNGADPCVPPAYWVVRLTSSMMNEVSSVESSTPSK